MSITANVIPQQCFITGTDTEVGKTYVSHLILQTLAQQNKYCLGIKPIASGVSGEDGLYNHDAICLQKVATVKRPYAEINPYLFSLAIAPHIAAQQAQKKIDIAYLVAHIHSLEEYTEYMLVEGVGGWLVPLNERETVADLAIQLQYPVILVVAMRLGCLNHALLTALAIEQSAVPFAGWIANTVCQKMPYWDENIKTLKERINAPLLAIIPAKG